LQCAADLAVVKTRQKDRVVACRVTRITADATVQLTPTDTAHRAKACVVLSRVGVVIDVFVVVLRGDWEVKSVSV